MVNKIAILLRGHIRDSFKSSKLIEFITNFISYYGYNRCDIYIHTWNLSEAIKSWRSLPMANTFKVDENIIRAYFGNMFNNIKKIIIEDDTKIRLMGSTTGVIFRTPCPKLSWKNMWYGNYKVCEYVHSIQPSLYKICINMRIDLFDVRFTQPTGITTNTIINRVKTQLTQSNPKLEFFNKPERYGIDNIYTSTVSSSYKLSTDFHFNLDRINETYIRVRHQEYAVPYVASDLGLTLYPILPIFSTKKRLINSKEVFSSTPILYPFNRESRNGNHTSKPLTNTSRSSYSKVKMKLIN